MKVGDKVVVLPIYDDRCKAGGFKTFREGSFGVIKLIEKDSAYPYRVQLEGNNYNHLFRWDEIELAV